VVMGFFFVWGGVWAFFNAPFDLLQYCVWH
jgi:hypothetical protein